MKKIVTLTALGLILAANSANAAGFHLREQSGAGLGNAFAGATAGAEDISYAYFNVAGLTRHKGTQMNLGATYIAPEARARKIEGNGSEDNVDNIVHAAVAPNMAFSHQLNDEVTLGLGVNVPFGMVTKYDDRNWAGADHGLTSKVTAVTTTPMVAWKATDKLSIGAGLPIQYFKAKLSQRTSEYGLGYTKLEGDTVDVGYQIGAMYEFNENTRLGINYRSEINHKLKGEIENKKAVSMGSTFSFLNQEIDARIDTPAMLSVGAFHKINDKWEVMAEYQKVFWNSFDSIDVYGRENGGHPIKYQGSNLISSTPEHWEDTDFYAIGASYNVDDKWKLRFGLAYDDSAVRKDYRTPRIPDSRRVWYSTGASYKYSDNLTFNAAYTFIKAEEAEIDLGNDLHAEYKNQVHIFGLSMNYSF